MKRYITSTVVIMLICAIFFHSIHEIHAANINVSLSTDSRLNTFYKETRTTILAGASAKVITPNLDRHGPIYLAGFNRNRKATGVHDDIWSRCCCMTIDETTIAFVSVDLIGVMHSEYCSILKRLPSEIHIDLVVLTSTHNHEGPDVIGLWGENVSTGIHWGWYQEAMDSIARSIVDSYETMQPAGIKFGHGEAVGLSRDSRDPECTDDQVETLQIVHLNETPIATIVFYGSHPEVLWDDNTLITADYPYYLCEYIETNLGGTAIFVTGAIGGLITPRVKNHTFEDARSFGEAIANISLASLQNTSVIWDTEIRTETKEIFVPLTNPLFRFASIFGLLTRPMYHFRKDVLSSVSIIELGEQGSLAQIVTVPGEDFPENWLELKEKLHGKHRILIGLGLDELGYIVAYEDFDWREYEESMSASKFLDPLIHETLEDMLTMIDE